MAKLSKVSAATMAQQEEVRLIRARYAEALRLGFSTTEAAELAQGGGEIKKQIAPSAPPVVAEAQTVQQPLEDHSVSFPDIPPGWRDLPWPELKRLADTLYGKDVKSRKLANEIIERVIAGEM